MDIGFNIKGRKCFTILLYMTSNAREIIASRLGGEMIRKGFDPTSLAIASKTPDGTIKGYLAGDREINFDELRPICQSLSLGMMRLLSKKFIVPRLQYRGAGAGNKAVVSAIEDAFLLVAEDLPKPKFLPVSDFRDHDGDIGMLLAEISRLVEGLRLQYPTVESIYNAARLPVLPIHAGSEAFDAFLMTAGNIAVVCVNADKPPIRIHFSMLHEMAHFLLNAKQDIPIDILPQNLYSDTILDGDKPEYIANKFAQLYLVPFAEAEKMAGHWRNLGDMAGYLTDRRTGPDVLTNALYDVLRFKDSKLKYTDVQEYVRHSASPVYGRANSIMDFIEERGRVIKDEVLGIRNEFSDEIWGGIAKAWEMPNG